MYKTQLLFQFCFFPTVTLENRLSWNLSQEPAFPQEHVDSWRSHSLGVEVLSYLHLCTKPIMNGSQWHQVCNTQFIMVNLGYTLKSPEVLSENTTPRDSFQLFSWEDLGTSASYKSLGEFYRAVQAGEPLLETWAPGIAMAATCSWAYPYLERQENHRMLKPFSESLQASSPASSTVLDLSLLSELTVREAA